MVLKSRAAKGDEYERLLHSDTDGDDQDFHNESFVLKNGENDGENEAEKSPLVRVNTSDTESVSSSTSRSGGDSSSVSDSLAQEQDDAGPFMTLTFRTTQALCGTLRLLLTVPEMCDVTFLVGPSRVPVHGIRAVLAARSRYFYHIIKDTQLKTGKMKQKTKKSNCKSLIDEVGMCRPLSERLAIPVKTYDPEVFRLLMEFVHCGSVEIAEDTVAGIYCGACQFKFPDLKTACLEFVDKCLVSGGGDRLLTSSRAYSHHSAARHLLDKIHSVLDGRKSKPSKGKRCS